MDSLQIIFDFWPIFLSLVCLIFWLGRLEGKIGENFRYTESVDRKVDVLTTKHEGLDSKTVEQLMQVRESLARIEGALGVKPTSTLKP